MRVACVGVVLTMATGIPLTGQRITFHGLGPVRVGVSVADATRAAGEELVEAEDQPSETDCHYVRLQSAPSVLFMVEEDRIVRIETGDPRFSTYSGVRVGDSEARVREVYGRRLEVTEHTYDDEGHYYIVRSADRRYALVMETNGHDVVFIRAGLVPAAEYVEGCL